MRYYAVKIPYSEQEFDLFTDVGNFLGTALVETSPLPSLEGAYFVVREETKEMNPQVILKTSWVKVLR